MADEKPIIVVKKKGGHGGHHGGAWKVAYADFVTAMMAFFMVMWLVNSASVQTKENIASYFRRPGLFESGSGTPLLIGEAGILNEAYVPAKPDQEIKQDSGGPGTPDSKKKKKSSDKDFEGKKDPKTSKDLNSLGVIVGKEDTKGVPVTNQQPGSGVGGVSIGASREQLQQLAKQIKNEIATTPQLQKLLGLVDVKLEGDGLHIEIMDTEKSSMFASGSARVQSDAQGAFQKIAELIKNLPNKIEIVGHTDAKPFSTRSGGLSNWELSADRANAARRLLEQQGIRADQIVSVVGRADKELRVPTDPFAATNRRISLKVKFDTPVQPPTSITDLNTIERINAPVEPPAPQEVPQQQPETKASTETEEEPKAEPTVVPTATPRGAGGYFPKTERLMDAKPKDTFVIPEENTAPDNKNPPPAKLFKDSPVLGPPDPFSNF